MTAAPSLTSASALKDGVRLSSSTGRDSQTPRWPLTEVPGSPAAVGGGDGGGTAVGTQQGGSGVQPRGAADVEQQQQQGQQQPPLSPSLGEKQRPWWKTRKAKIGYAVGAVLFVVFVVLLVLGLLGYLRKVGPFASLVGNANKDTSLSSPPNPLSTINLMSDPFAHPATTPTPTTTPLSVPVAPAATATLSTNTLPNPVAAATSSASTVLSPTNAVRANSALLRVLCEISRGVLVPPKHFAMRLAVMTGPSTFGLVFGWSLFG